MADLHVTEQVPVMPFDVRAVIVAVPGAIPVIFPDESTFTILSLLLFQVTFLFEALLGVYVMSILKTGLPLIGLQANWQQIITGIVLLVAVFIDVVRGKNK